MRRALAAIKVIMLANGPRFFGLEVLHSSHFAAAGSMVCFLLAPWVSGTNHPMRSGGLWTFVAFHGTLGLVGFMLRQIPSVTLQP